MANTYENSAGQKTGHSAAPSVSPDSLSTSVRATTADGLAGGLNTQEEWRPVVGYEGRYEVSRLGRVQQIPGPTLLAPGIRGRGYHSVQVGGKTRYVHHLVAEAFIGPRPDGYTVNHKDMNKTNNTVDNLEYMTNLENIRHARARKTWKHTA